MNFAIYYLSSLMLFLCNQINSYRTLFPGGVEFNSISLVTYDIFAINSYGVLLLRIGSPLISLNTYPNKTSEMELAQYSDGKVIAFNGLEIFFFSQEGKYISQSDYNFFKDQGTVGYYFISIYSSDSFLLLGIVNGNPQLTLNKNDITLLHEGKYNSLFVLGHGECLKRILDQGVVCSFILDDPQKNLGILILTETLSKVDLLTVPTYSGQTLIMRIVGHNYFLICYLNDNTDACCAFYNDETMVLSNTIIIATNTKNYKHTQIDAINLSSKEILFAYAYNDGTTFIHFQKLNYNGQLIERPISIQAFPTNSHVTNIRINSFSITQYKTLYEVLYSPTSGGIYFLDLDISFCYDYCTNVELNSVNTIDLSIYSSSLFISFTSNISKGKLQYNGTDINLINQYSIAFAFTFISDSVKTIASTNFVTVNQNGLSVPCMLNIFVGEKGNCKCMELYYNFQNNCVRTCPIYTYTDHDLRECVNCATLNKYLYKGKCQKKIDLPFETYISNITYNVVEKCKSPCETCIGNADKCLSCRPGLSCVLFCGTGYFSSTTLGKCVKCYESCASCSDVGNVNDHKCITCMNGFESVPSSPDQCNLACKDSSKSRWYIDDAGQFHCILSTQCPGNRKIYTKDSNQCVESCSKTSSCLICQWNPQSMFNYTNTCVTICPSGTIANEKTNTCDYKSNIDIEITDKPLNETINDLNSSIITKPNSTIIKGDSFVVEIINTTDKGGNLQSSQINFSRCEAVLRKEYSIPSDDVLFIVKIDIERETEVTNQVEYIVYDSKGNKLDLKYCDNTTVDIIYQITNTSDFDIETAKEFEKIGVDIYNPDDPFFSDICFYYSTENGTDITLKDRLKYVYQNISLCEKSCEYKGVDLENLTISCTCNVKKEINTEIDTNFFINSFSSAFTESNFMVVKCYKLVFNPKYLLNNIGFWFYLVLLFCHLPNWIFYFIYGSLSIQKYLASCPGASPKKKAKDYIDRIISEYKSDQTNEDKDGIELEIDAFKSVNNKEMKKNNSEKKTFPNNNRLPMFDEKNKGSNEQDTKEDLLFSQNINIIKNNGGSVYQKESFNQIQNKNNLNIVCNLKPKISKNSLNSTYNTYNSYICNENEKNELNVQKKTEEKFPIDDIRNIGGKSNKKGKKGQASSKFSLAVKNSGSTTTIGSSPITNNYRKALTTMKSLPKYKDPSMEILDDFDLISAKLYDTRTFWRLLYICLKAKHPILSTFVKQCNLSLRAVIIITFIFGNVMDFAFNALFYTEELISNRYHYEGNLGFLFTLQNNMVASLASFLVSLLIGSFLNLLSTSENKFELLIKCKKDKNKYNKLFNRTIKCFKWKLVFFLIFELLLMLFFWYYVIAFCAVYPNSQISWFTGGLTTFTIGLLIPLPICLAIILIRKLAIFKRKKCLFKTVIWFYKL